MVATINKPLSINSNILMFPSQDLEDVNSIHDDALVIKVQISNALSQLYDNGSKVNILFKDAAERMRILDRVN